MKKITALILLLLYLTVSTGALVNIHYCMGSVRSIDFTVSKGDTCSRCGMKNKTGCCHEDCKIIKLGLDQQVAKANTNILRCIPDQVLRYSGVVSIIQRNEKISKTSYHSPPDRRSSSIYLHDSVLRI